MSSVFHVVQVGYTGMGMPQQRHFIPGPPPVVSSQGDAVRCAQVRKVVRAHLLCQLLFSRSLFTCSLFCYSHCLLYPVQRLIAVLPHSVVTTLSGDAVSKTIRRPFVGLWMDIAKRKEIAIHQALYSVIYEVGNSTVWDYAWWVSNDGCIRTKRDIR
jgi:hypothetical protein